MTTTRREVNATIDCLGVRLVQGKGYCYFEQIDGDWFSDSIPVCRVGQMDLGYWVRRAQEAAAVMREVTEKY